MLSRLAESLFWIGRYTERADGTARVLSAHAQMLLEDPWVDESAECRSLLRALGCALGDDPVDRGTLLRRLSLDRSEPASVATSLWHAREDARGARDILSTELWETLNTTATGLPSRLDQDRAHEFLRWVSERAALVVGVIEMSVVRDTTYWFLRLGRAIEHADALARLLGVWRAGGAGSPSWATVLRACGGDEAYQHAYRGAPGGRDAAEFLLLDRLFPRSVLYSLVRAEECVRRLEPEQPRTGVGGRAAVILGRARTELEYSPLDQILADLPSAMGRVQLAAQEASDAVRERFFPEHVEPSWIGEAS